MTKPTGYYVIHASSIDLEAERAGSQVLYEGDAAGVVGFFQDLTHGLPYAILSAAPPGRREHVRGALLRFAGLAAQLRAGMLGLRVLFPVEPGDLESSTEDQDLDVPTMLDQWLYDELPRLERELHRLIYAESPEEAAQAERPSLPR